MIVAWDCLPQAETPAIEGKRQKKAVTRFQLITASGPWAQNNAAPFGVLRIWQNLIPSPRSGGGYELETCHSFLLSLSFDGRCFRLGQAIPCHYHLRRPSKRDPFCQRRSRAALDHHGRPQACHRL